MIIKPAKKSAQTVVTTNDLMDVMHDMMQMTSDGFQRVEERLGSLEDRSSSMEGRLDSMEGELQSIKLKLMQHDLQFIELRRIAQDLTDKHSAYINDIADLLDRVVALEKQMPHITKEELYELQHMLQRLVDWAIEAAKKVKVPLKLP